MDYNSSNLEKVVNTLSKYIYDEYRDLGYGYIRKYSWNNNKINIPSYIIDYCLLYAFLFFGNAETSWKQIQTDEINWYTLKIKGKIGKSTTLTLVNIIHCMYMYIFPFHKNMYEFRNETVMMALLN